ncbi:MAG TPA: hypothetical protein VIV60_02350 [Polyangiaceae bacterium]
MTQLINSLGSTITRGATAGTIATLAMSAVMLELQDQGWLGRMPPQLIVDRVLSSFSLKQRTRPVFRHGLSSIAHLGFGTAMGVTYAAGTYFTQCVSPQDRQREPTLRTAIPFAVAVWASSYAGWLPALGLMPAPSRDRPGRPISMLAAHIVYGATLAVVLRALNSPKANRDFRRQRRPSNITPPP